MNCLNCSNKAKSGNFCSDDCKVMFTQQCAPKTKHKKRQEAIERNKHWSSLSGSDKLSILTNRRGNSKKQITKLTDKLIDKLEKHLDKAEK